MRIGTRNIATACAEVDAAMLMPHWKVALAEYIDEIKQSGQAQDFEESKHGTAN
jgi:hypothetical protein